MTSQTRRRCPACGENAVRVAWWSWHNLLLGENYCDACGAIVVPHSPWYADLLGSFVGDYLFWILVFGILASFLSIPIAMILAGLLFVATIAMFAREPLREVLIVDSAGPVRRLIRRTAMVLIWPICISLHAVALLLLI